MRKNASAMPVSGETTWRPLAHVAVRDEGLRAEISIGLRAEGWAVVESPSGYHLLQTMAEPLFANECWVRPQLVVVDAVSPGCSGLTIARGLQNLGWVVPSVLIVHTPDQAARVADDPDRWLFVADRDVALHTVLEVARIRIRKGIDAFSAPQDEDFDQERDADEAASHVSAGSYAGDRRALA